MVPCFSDASKHEPTGRSRKSVVDSHTSINKIKGDVAKARVK